MIISGDDVKCQKRVMRPAGNPGVADLAIVPVGFGKGVVLVSGVTGCRDDRSKRRRRRVATADVRIGFGAV